jgi:hypothetical protein
LSKDFVGHKKKRPGKAGPQSVLKQA